MARQHACAALLGMVVLSLAWLPAIEAAEADKKESAPKVSSEDAIRHALASKTTFDFRETPLTDAIDFLRTLHKINIRFDARALSDAGILTDTPVTLNVDAIPLQSALETLLGEVHLTSVLRDEVLQITTPDVASTVQSVRTLDVSDLVMASHGEPGSGSKAQTLIDVIQAAVAPTSWDVVGGNGAMTYFNGLLVVTQSDAGQQQVADLLRAIREARGADYSKGTVRIWARAEGEQSAAIHSALQQRVALEFQDTPLADVADYLRHQYHVPVVIDYRALADAGVDKDAPVSIHVENIRLESALKLALQSASLTYSVHGDLLHITTPEAANAERVIAVYGIRDLIESYTRATGSDAIDASEELMTVILSTVAPASWDDAGGQSSIDGLPEFGELVVSQTSEGHREVTALLAQLRQTIAARKQTAKSEPAQPEKFKLVVYTLTPPIVVEGQTKNAEPPKAADVEKLVIELVAPESWKESQALIRSSGDRLFIRQSAAVHREIANFLSTHSFATSSLGMGGGGGFFSVPSGPK